MSNEESEGQQYCVLHKINDVYSFTNFVFIAWK